MNLSQLLICSLVDSFFELTIVIFDANIGLQKTMLWSP